MREFGEYRTRKRVLDAWDRTEYGDSARGCMNLPRQISHAPRGCYQRYPYAVRTVMSPLVMPLVMEDDRDKIVSSDRAATGPRGSCARQGEFFHINIWVR